MGLEPAPASWCRYHASPLPKFWSKNRTSLRGGMCTCECAANQFAKEVVPAFGAPMTKNVGSGPSAELRAVMSRAPDAKRSHREPWMRRHRARGHQPSILLLPGTIAAHH